MSKVFIYDASMEQETIFPGYRVKPMHAKGLYVNGHFISDFTRIVDTDKEELILEPSEKIVFTYSEDMKDVAELYEYI